MREIFQQGWMDLVRDQIYDDDDRACTGGVDDGKVAFEAPRVQVRAGSSDNEDGSDVCRNHLIGSYVFGDTPGKDGFSGEDIYNGRGTGFRLVEQHDKIPDRGKPPKLPQ
jgi:hypothetical protein